MTITWSRGPPLASPQLVTVGASPPGDGVDVGVGVEVGDGTTPPPEPYSAVITGDVISLQIADRPTVRGVHDGTQYVGVREASSTTKLVDTSREDAEIIGTKATASR